MLRYLSVNRLGTLAGLLLALAACGTQPAAELAPAATPPPAATATSAPSSTSPPAPSATALPTPSATVEPTAAPSATVEPGPTYKGLAEGRDAAGAFTLGDPDAPLVITDNSDFL